eukprot:2854334-Alexandrium_andersonii.AAC.1
MSGRHQLGWQPPARRPAFGGGALRSAGLWWPCICRFRMAAACRSALGGPAPWFALRAWPAQGYDAGGRVESAGCGPGPAQRCAAYVYLVIAVRRAL